MAKAMSRNSIFVNALTFSRLPMTIAWLGFALAGEFGGGVCCAVLAVMALFISGMTDLADGLLARRWNVVTPLGKMADPLMDKAVYAVVFPALTWFVMRHGEVPHSLLMLAFTILYLLRDLWVTFMRSVASMYGADVAARRLGKVRTALTFPLAGLVYIYIAAHGFMCAECARISLFICVILELAMIALNFVSFVEYTRAYMPFIKKALEMKR